MIDFNNDGKLDDEDWILSEIILDEEENEGSKGSKPNGSCLGSVMLFIGVPLAFFFIGQHLF